MSRLGRPQPANGAAASARAPGVRAKYRPGIRTILLLVNLFVLVLPLGGLVFFRVYENQLVRETEAELIAQASVVAALYRHAVRSTLPDAATFGVPLGKTPRNKPDDRYTPLPPRLDLAVEDILPSRPDARLTDIAVPDDIARLGADVASVFLLAQQTTLAGFRLLDHRGIVIGGRGEVGRTLAHVGEIGHALAGRYKAVLRHRALNAPAPPLASISRGTGVRIFAAYPIVENGRLWGVVYLSRTPNNILRHIYASRYRFMLIGLGIVLVTLVLAWITSRTIGQPVDGLALQARRLARSEPTGRVPLPHYGTREVAILGQSLLDMADALEARSDYLRNFAGHVSHEFKTPLTGIRGAVELLIEHAETMSRDERRKFLAHIAADTERLSSLVTGLLELARADNRKPEAADTPLCAALERVGATVALEFGMTIVVSGPSNARAPITEEQLGIVVRNLAQNASQSGAGRLDIEVTADRAGHAIRVRDDGRGISKGNRGRVFEPFFTTRRENGGTGLGLRIVVSVLEAHGGRIALADPQPEKGAIFEIWLPETGGKRSVR